MAKIHEQILKVMKDLTYIEKDSTNSQQGFKFRSIDHIYNELHPLLVRHGVFIAPKVISSSKREKTTKSGALMNYTEARIRYTYYADDGSSMSVVVLGEGADAGDKSSGKCMSNAHKYAIMQTFCIPTKEPKDPDEESHEIASTRSLKSW